MAGDDLDAAPGGDGLRDVVRQGLDGAAPPATPPSLDDVVAAGRRRRASRRLGAGGGALVALLVVVLLVATVGGGSPDGDTDLRMAERGTDVTGGPVPTDAPTTTSTSSPSTTEAPPVGPEPSVPGATVDDPTIPGAPAPTAPSTTTSSPPAPTVATASLDRTTGLRDGQVVTLDVRVVSPPVGTGGGAMQVAVHVEGAGAIAAPAEEPRVVDGDRQLLPVMVTPWRADGSSCAPGGCALRVVVYSRTKYENRIWDTYDIPLEFAAPLGQPPAAPTVTFDPPGPWTVPPAESRVPLTVAAMVEGLRPGEPVEVVYTDCSTGSAYVMDGFKPRRWWVVADAQGRVPAVSLSMYACTPIQPQEVERYVLRRAVGPAWSVEVVPEPSSDPSVDQPG